MLSNLMTPDAIVFAAGLSFVLGYLIINQLILRSFMILGTLLYIWYYSVAADTPLWSAVWTSVAMGLANIIGLIKLIGSKSPRAIPRQHKDIYPMFSVLPPGEFRRLMRAGRRSIYEWDRVVSVEGRPIDRLYFVITGDISVEKTGRAFDLPSGLFVGEVAFLRSKESAATTHVKAGADVVEWDFETLRNMSRKSPSFKMALELVLAKDLAAKVSGAVPRENEDLSQLKSVAA